MTKLGTAQPKALIIHCSDPRFQEAFKNFICGNLDLAEGEYIPIVIPGSVSVIGGSINTLLPKNYKALMDQIQLMLEHNKEVPLRLILINHEDCKGYAFILEKLKKLNSKLPDVIERQVSDLEFAAQAISLAAKKFNIKYEFELYMARIGPDNEIVFDKYILSK